MKKNVMIFDHALISDALTVLRNKKTPSSVFREMVKIITTVMGCEVLKDLQLKTTKFETPLGKTTGQVILDSNMPTLVPIMRAGNGMLSPMLELLPNAKVGFIGLRRIEGGDNKSKGKKRDKVLLEEYLNKIPKDIGKRGVIILDPMLASGSSASYAITLLKKAGAKDIVFVCLVSCYVGINKVLRDHPDVVLYCATKDPKLLKNNYIFPGLGDAGDRLYC